MPSYLGFTDTKVFRDFLISKTLQQPNGPQTFTAANYTVQNLRSLANVDPGDVETNLPALLNTNTSPNPYKPPTFLTILATGGLRVNPQGGQRQKYPYFTEQDHNLVDLIFNDSKEFPNESDLQKFAIKTIRDRDNGPVYSRITQNLTAATLGKVRVLDALSGNIATATNLLTGKERLIEKNFKITTPKTLIGKGIDFLGTVAGVELPFTTIPGDYLTNPMNPIVNRPEAKTELGKLGQDISGGLGSIVGIQRRQKDGRKPSDLFIEYMGGGQKQELFNQLAFSKYAPNYTTTARSQNSSKIFNFVDRFAQGVKKLVGAEAPAGISYIGDDRSENVLRSMADNDGNLIRGSYYLSLMFDEKQAKLFERQRNISEGGSIAGKLTWIGQNSRNKLGLHNAEFQESESSTFNDSLSTSHEFRDNSILGNTQNILDSMPKDGMSSQSHVGNVIDQTSRVFREGESMMSRGSAIQYVNSFTNQPVGTEYCRVWTKDRSYMNYSDTMKRTTLLRKYDDSVLSKPWNLNIAPMSSGKFDPTGKNSFGKGNSTNILERTPGSNDFYAKKYMFSIENLAWRTSDTPGFTYADLPACERGNNKGRVMWFPPYDLKVTEQNNANWKENTFIGRPEPIYTYQDTSRTGQISFKVVVDHPSILNLLVREQFKGMTDEESDNYINAFFAGCEDLDFYDLIKRFSFINQRDAELINAYLNNNASEDTITTYKYTTTAAPIPAEVNDNQQKVTAPKQIVLFYDNDEPKPDELTSRKYGDFVNSYTNQKDNHVNRLDVVLRSVTGITSTDQLQLRKELKHVYGRENEITTNEGIETQKDKLSDHFDDTETSYSTLKTNLESIKEILDNPDKKIGEGSKITIESSASSAASNSYNQRLSFRRSHSIVLEVIDKLKKGDVDLNIIKWPTNINTPTENFNFVTDADGKVLLTGVKIPFKDLGYDQDGFIEIKTINKGEKSNETLISGNGNTTEDKSCSEIDFRILDDLKTVAPLSSFCRKSRVDIKYVETIPPPPPPAPKDPVTKIEPNGTVKIQNRKKPSIDQMKRIITRTLSECFYFKKLEEDSPVAFKSLTEKLKYFHPAFHSTTPEGLNSRLTFLLQCVRPGDTIPVKGLSDEIDINARNTSFGPPPICVIRVGDFYHSKIIIRDVNIEYEDNLWDLNPEGIGVQPMIAKVTCQIAFIGGQGLSKPVDRLQNALSSNFFANTEIFDERSISTGSKIDGKEEELFRKAFLEDLRDGFLNPDKTPEQPVQGPVKGKHIGEFVKETSGISYGGLVDDVFENNKNYYESYEKMYNNVLTNYGHDMLRLAVHPDYREIKEYQYSNGTSTDSINLFGNHKKGKEFATLTNGYRDIFIRTIDTGIYEFSKMLGFDRILGTARTKMSDDLLRPIIVDIVKERFDSLLINSSISDFEKVKNKLITSLDQVNYIVKHGKDATIDEKTQKRNSSTISGVTTPFSKTDIYDEYSKVISYIKKNDSKTYNQIESGVNFILEGDKIIENESPFPSGDGFNILLEIVSPGIVRRMLSVFLYKEQNRILEPYKVDPKRFTDKIMEKLRRQLEKFVTNPSEQKLKFTRLPKRKNGSDLSYFISTETEVTSGSEYDDMNKIFSTSSISNNNFLNWYKP